MTELKGSVYWNICGDAFTFLKEALPIQNTDEYWRWAMNRADQIYRKYEFTEAASFANEQVLSVVNELDHRYQAERRKSAERMPDEHRANSEKSVLMKK